MSEAKFVPHTDYQEYPEAEMQQRAAEFYTIMRRRRTVREYSNREVPREVIEQCILTAGTAPNGANLQPWHFVVVSDPAIKKQIRAAAEEEERDFYERRAPKEWLQALEPFATDWHKPFLEEAPILIVVMAQSYSVREDGEQVKHYYVQESVGIATGFLVAACHMAGLATLTHTPSPMGFLNEILGRPKNERPYLILVVGYPVENVQVPAITKKPLEQITSFK